MIDYDQDNSVSHGEDCLVILPIIIGQFPLIMTIAAKADNPFRHKWNISGYVATTPTRTAMINMTEDFNTMSPL
jgi:hypothetical protein